MFYYLQLVHATHTSVVQVHTSTLSPDLRYTTLSVTMTTTAYEIIHLLVERYAVNEEDKDPRQFLLKEVNCELFQI